MANILTTQTPEELGNIDGQVSVGARISTTGSSHTVTGIRYYKGYADGDGVTRIVQLWDTNPLQLLASGTRQQAANDPAGWIVVPLSSQVALTPNHQYLIVYNTGAPNTSYAYTPGGLSGSIVAGDLTMHASSYYDYGAATAAPTSTATTNYFVDVETTAPAVPTVPTADAGPDQTGIEPGDNVTLTGASSGGSAPTTGHAWRQISGPAVTLAASNTASATYRAPLVAADSSLVFGYIATNSVGDSTETSVVHRILHATEQQGTAGGSTGILFHG